MRTRAALAGIPATVVLLLSLAACGSDDASSDTTVAAATSGEPAPSTDPAPAATEPASTDAPATTAADDGTVRIDVTVGTDSGEDRIEQVPVGSTVVLSITDPSAAQEYHVHGVDLGDGQEFEPGQTATFTFTADTAGTYEVESHLTEAVLVVLQVS